MISDIFNLIFYQPLYNGLVFLTAISPYESVGLAVIILTLFVRLLLLPLTHKSTKAQARMRELEPELRKIKEKYKDKREEQSKKTMELYKERGINPFSGCLLFIVQIPVLLGLFWAIWKGLGNGLDIENLYAFVVPPDEPTFSFLHFINLAEKSLLLSLFAGATQYFQLRFSMPKTPPKKDGEKMSFRDEFTRNFGLQMRYGLPVFVFLITYFSFPGSVALYWTTSNAFSIGHELLIKRRTKHATQKQESPNTRAELGTGQARIKNQEKSSGVA